MVEAREVASSVVGEKKPVTEGDGVAPCREAWKGKEIGGFTFILYFAVGIILTMVMTISFSCFP